MKASKAVLAAGQVFFGSTVVMQALPPLWAGIATAAIGAIQIGLAVMAEPDPELTDQQAEPAMGD